MPGPVEPRVRELARAKPLSDLVPGPNPGPFRAAVSGVEIKTTKAGKAYLEVTLADRTGMRVAKCFDGAPLANEFRIGTAVELRSLSHDTAYGPKFEPQDVRFLKEGEYAAAEFVPSLAAERVEALWREFHGFLDSIRNPHLQALRKKIWGDEVLAAKYKWHPSAVRHHHNYRGGNLEHVVGIMRIIEAVATGYPELGRNVAIFGAAVHDLGKLWEYEVGTTIQVTEIGRLKGHIVIGAEEISRLIKEMRTSGTDFPQGLEDHLTHLIISHHGKPEWGSPKPPATAEANLLHLADYADSHAKGFLMNQEQNRDAVEGWARVWDSDLGESRNIKTQLDPDWL